MRHTTSCSSRYSTGGRTTTEGLATPSGTPTTDRPATLDLASYRAHKTRHEPTMTHDPNAQERIDPTHEGDTTTDVTARTALKRQPRDMAQIVWGVIDDADGLTASERDRLRTVAAYCAGLAEHRQLNAEPATQGDDSP